MKVNTRLITDNGYISIMLAAFFVFFIYPGASFSSEEPAAVPHEELEWVEVAPFVHMSTVNGDMDKGKHGTMGKMKPGMKTPVHTHSAAYHGVVISGTMTHQFGDEKDPPKLTAGSYWYVPAGKEHFTTCYPEAPCIFYFHSDEKFDMTEVNEK
jgi:quercetin dioxygenase-like cupin family protein